MVNCSILCPDFDGQFCRNHLEVDHLNLRQSFQKPFLISGGLSLGWAKAGIAILRGPDQKAMVGTLCPSAQHTQKGFGQGTLTTEIWAFFQILGDFQFFNFEAINS